MKSTDIGVCGTAAMQPHLAQDMVHSTSPSHLRPPAYLISAPSPGGMHDLQFSSKMLHHHSIPLKTGFRPEAGVQTQSW